MMATSTIIHRTVSRRRGNHIGLSLWNVSILTHPLDVSSVGLPDLSV
jgi:hypothetical protein